MTQHYAKSEQMVERTVRDEQVLVPIGGHADELDALYNLNETAALIFNAAGGGLTAGEIAAKLAAEFEISASGALEDAQATLAELTAIGALIPAVKEDA